MLRMVTILAGALLTGAAPAVAQAPQPRTIMVSADAPFAHANSGLTLPASLIDLPRREVREIESPELDVYARYVADDRELTIYVYRSLTGAIPVWFDRTASAVESRDFGKLTVAAPTIAIAPPGRSIASGLIAGWTIADGRKTGTAAALLPLGEWTVKIRYTTEREDGTTAVSRVRQALAGLTWPTAASDGSTAQPIAGCATPLAFTGRAKSVKTDSQAAIVGALLSAAAADVQPDAKNESPPRTWCRDAVKLPMAAAYRADDTSDGYLLAISDAGRGVWVQKSEASFFAKPAKPGWSVVLVTPGKTVNYPSQDRLPDPTRVMQILGEALTSTVTTWGKNRNVSLSKDVFK